MNAPARIDVPATDKPTGLALLRVPFPENLISKLPKETKAQADERKANRNSGVNCKLCGGWHHKNAVHLDYVGHAALTDRLLDADPEWEWEPLATTPEGLPLFDQNGGLWIKLTVCGKTRLGYGNAEGKRGGDAVKEIIGDALRSAAMRFGAALDLWHKGDLHADEADEPAQQQGNQRQQGLSDAEWAKLTQLLQATKTQAEKLLDYFRVKNLRQLDPSQYAEAIERLEFDLAKMARAETDTRAQQPQTGAAFGIDDEIVL